MVHGNSSGHPQAHEVFTLKRSSNLFYDNKRFTEAALSVSQTNQDDLRLQLSSMPIDAYIDCIPQSLLLLDTLYSKFSLYAKDQEEFPIAILKPNRLVRQLIWFLTRELDPGVNKRKMADWKLVGPRLRNLMRVVHFMCPMVKEQLKLEKGEIDKALEGLGLHGLVNFGDRNLIEIGEAVKHEISDHYHRVKSLSQQIEKLLQKMPYNECGNTSSGGSSITRTYSINELGGPVPSQSSHQRLMNLRLSEIKGRLQRNECMIQIVQNCLRNADLQSLERILQKRIRYDRDILTQFTFLTTRNATYGLTADDPVVSHILVLFDKGYEKLIKLMPYSTNTPTDDSGLGDENEERSHLISEGRGFANSSSSNGSAMIDAKERIEDFSRASENKHRRIASRRYRRAASSAHASYDLNGNRPLNRPLPKLSIFRPPSPPTNSQSSSSESPFCFSSGDRFYSSLPCLIDGPLNAQKYDADLETRQLMTGYTPYNGNGFDFFDHDKSEICRLQSQVEQLNAALESAQNKLKKQQRQLESIHIFNPKKINDHGQPQILDLIEKYGNLYTNERLETMQELDRLPELKGAEDLQMKILLSVVVLSFRFVWRELYKAKEDVWRVLHENKSVHETECDANNPGFNFLHHLGEFLLAKAKLDNFSKTAKQVSQQLHQTLYEFSSLKTCHRLIDFITDCANVAWHLSTAKPTCSIEFDDADFNVERHMRYHTSDLQAKQVKRFVWPALVESNTRKCIYRGVVIT